MSKARDLADFISDSTIETAELADNAVTSAKLDETDSYTVAGLTATTITGSGDMNIDSGALFVDVSEGIVGIGTTNPSFYNSSFNNLVISEASNAGITIATPTNGLGQIAFADGTAGDQAYRGLLRYDHATDHFAVYTAGLNERTRIDSSGTLIHKAAATFNEDGGDSDFRVESDASTHMLFVEAGTNQVAVNDDNPNSTFHVKSTGVAGLDFSQALTVEGYGTGSNGDAACIAFAAGDNTRKGGITFTRNNSYGRGYMSFLVDGAADFNAPTISEEVMRLNSSNVVINDYSRDVDFRVESNNNANMIFVDAGNDRVGIANSSPASALDVTGNITVSGGIFHQGDTDTSFSFQTNGMTATVGNQNAIKIESGTTIFNEDSLDRDFRVESDTNANAFVVDGALGGIGIGAGASGDAALRIFGNSTESQAMRIDANSNNPVQINMFNGFGARQGITFNNNGSTAYTSFGMISENTALTFKTASYTVGLSDLTTNWTERMRLTSSGILLVNTTTADPHNSTNPGTYIGGDGYVLTGKSNDAPIYANRITNDGNVIVINQNGTTEGGISVSGSTVSYNGGHLARWSRLADDSKDTSIVKGTVMTNLDAMVEWGDEDNEQLNKMAVSSVEGDANVAGVFVNWDEDDDWNDMNIAMTGDMVIRIAQGTTVARGDLLMSAGDGTAKPQGDDIVRSKTIAKVTSTHVSHTYDDGSYLVPCVLMAC